MIGGVATFVYSVGHFHRFPAYGLAGNLLAMPIISTIVMPMALVSMMLMPFGLDGFPLWIMGRGIDWIIVLAKWVSGWGGEVVTGRLPPLAFALIAIAGGLVCMFRTRLAIVVLVPLVIGVALAFAHRPDAQPQLLISEDGRLVALIWEGEAATNRSNPPDFLYDQWRRAIRLEGHRAPKFQSSSESKQRQPSSGRGSSADRREAIFGGQPDTQQLTATRNTRTAKSRAVLSRAAMARVNDDMRTALATAVHEKRFVCRRKEWCVGVAPAGWRVVTLEDPAFLGAACDNADFVVAPLHLKAEPCRSGAQLITMRTLRQSGALEIMSRLAEPTARDDYTIRQAITSLHRPWSRHRLYDWRTEKFLEPQIAAATDSGE
nr:ComEC/Rec2 family competence protein [Rhizobium sp. ARZ01]